MTETPAPVDGAPVDPVTPAQAPVTAPNRSRWAIALRAVNVAVGALLVGWGTTHGADLYVILGAVQVVTADLLTEYGSASG